ncbi:hypothetical protein XHC_2114 [Xanthomonas hortorum pv. carotae str. M081]|nr:hypothetical protein XHC_2114 [Xanthomonas hortorum pv. carotae str. M081]
MGNSALPENAETRIGGWADVGALAAPGPMVIHCRRHGAMLRAPFRGAGR